MSVVKRPGAASKWYLPGIFKGLGITLGHLLKNLANPKKMQTLNYPEEKYEYGPRFKGNHVLTVKKDGSLRCTACMLCATNCPADCITIVASQHPDPSVEKYPISYEIDVLRCVFCGYCEEACPVDAVRMGPEWQSAGINGSGFVHGIDYLAYRPQLKGGIQTVLDDKERHSEGI
ncbi:MAG: NADH-quinone oxidoreductase subunit I [Bdellovibrionales bacterium CG10_big_fil_rev_8_21_14_0_10_45_34]|nr:MAG: NADH-quinone oxidoreductase subunit I [Bdellovibrionales bacterium CG10_big_fil_rev_8_21_14_0_10_45_34]